MNDFLRNFLTEWRRLKLPAADETFVIAVSGGADSCALLAAAEEARRREKLNLRFVAAHFNHHLRGAESDADEDFVRELAIKYDFELAVGHAELAGVKENLEQAARNARYAFLRDTAVNLRARAILTAHTVNDQAETFLMNLLRGSGVEGLAGMKPVRLFETNSEKSGLLLARPLLAWASREATEAYCHEREIEYRSDSMNEDIAFKRVRIRRVLLPLLKDFNPQIVEILAATAAGMDDYAEIAAERTELFRTETLTVADLKPLTDGVRRIVVREWLRVRRGGLRGIEAAHLQSVADLAVSEKSGRTAQLPGGEIVEKKGGMLHFGKVKVEKSPDGN